MTNQLIVADCRRATALVCHFGRSNVEGIGELFREAIEAERITELLCALLGLYSNIVPVLSTRLGMRCLSEIIVAVAHHDDDPSCRRAARLVIAHDARDAEDINDVLREAMADDTISDLFLALMGLYATIVPALHTDVGLSALQAAALDLATVEAGEE